jgi:hypothetical protein
MCLKFVRDISMSDGFVRICRIAMQPYFIGFIDGSGCKSGKNALSRVGLPSARR